MASERVKSLVAGLAVADEVDYEVAEKYPHLYDLQAYRRVAEFKAEKKASVTCLDVPDEVFRDEACSKRAMNLLRELSASLNCYKVGRTYAYAIVINVNDNAIDLHYSSSFNDYARFEELLPKLRGLSASINHMLWDTIEHLRYVATVAKHEEVRRKVVDFYKRVPAKYIDVLVGDNGVTIYVPRQLKGYVIGKGGSTVQRLQQLLGKRVRVIDDLGLTELYESEHPELPRDPEIMKLVAEILPKIKELERKGVTLRQLEKIIESIEKPEQDVSAEEGW